MVSKELADLDEQENTFVKALFENGGNIAQAAETAKYSFNYGYRLRDRLAKAITQAAQEYLAMNSVKAAAKIVNSMDAEMPNPIHLQAANSLLDRVGIIKRDFAEENRNVIKANIFILPEKRTQEIVDTVYTAITDK